jgi:hypothetical protein
MSLSKSILPPDFSRDYLGLSVRFVQESDAPFILSLRTDPKLGRFLSETSSDVADQVQWIRHYKEREAKGEDYYFLFLDADHPLGVIRLYNFKETSFEYGSWLFRPGLLLEPFKADMFAKEMGFLNFGYTSCTFEVVKENKSVLSYHTRWGTVKTHEDEEKFYFTLSKDSFLAHHDAWKKRVGS